MRRVLALSAFLFLPWSSAAAQEIPDATAADAGQRVEEEAVSTPATPPVASENVPPTNDLVAAAPAAADGAAALTTEELEALGFETDQSSGEASGLDTDLHVSGFIDFSFSRLIAKKSSPIRGFLPNRSSFYVGNFNLYLTKNLAKSFRTMGEVRFLYMPNGDIPLASGVGTRTTMTQDPADFDRNLRWGGIEIERVYLEWSAHTFITIRGGQFLTPYGVWNVDHGSPTFIPVQRPYVVGEALFPERQTGIEIFGRWDPTQNGTLGYHLTLSNGEGPISEYRDLDDNKAIGGRLFWEQHNAGLRIGASGYYGRSTDAISSVGLGPDGKARAIDKLYYQFDVLSLAVDAVWKFRDLLIQAEWISRQRVYTTSGRVAGRSDTLQQVLFPPDAFNWGVYGLVGYRLPWFGVMPYFVGQYLDNTGTTGIRSQVTNLQGGLNIRPLDVLVVKLEYSHAFFRSSLLGSNDPIRFIQAQVAWAF